MKKIYLLLVLFCSCSVQDEQIILEPTKEITFDAWRDERWLYVRYTSDVYGFDLYIANTLSEIQNPSSSTYHKYKNWSCIFNQTELNHFNSDTNYIRIIQIEVDTIIKTHINE